VLDNDERGTEFLPGAFKSVMRCNWKVPAENFTGDALHAGWTHDAGSQAVFGKGINPTSEDGLQININGHGWQVDSKYPVGNAATLGYKSILRYFREREPAVLQWAHELQVQHDVERDREDTSAASERKAFVRFEIHLRLHP